jgi:hypothetical protein
VLCYLAEQAVDADDMRYEQTLLPKLLVHLGDWPSSLRRCPDRWFRTPRPRPDLLLRLGAVTAGDLSSRAAHRFVDDYSSSSLGPPSGWTVFSAADLEFTMDGDDAGPDPIGLQVAAFVRSHWPDIQRAAEDAVNDGASDWDDPYARKPVPPGRRRFESDDIVTIDPTPPGFTVHCRDCRHNVNGWPYGFWMVDFAWGSPTAVRVGTYDHNYPWGRQPQPHT